MPVSIMIFLAILLAGLIGIALAALLAFRLSQNARSLLVAFAAGVMLSSAWLDLLPEASALFSENTAHASAESHQTADGTHPAQPHNPDNPTETPPVEADSHHDSPFFALFATVFFGILGFFALEHLAIWRHAHSGCGHDAHEGTASTAPLILIGDGFHNFVDGFLIAAAFLADPLLGVTTTFAIIAHEIPQELGDFVLLLHAGYSRTKAFLANCASGLTALIGGLAGYFFMADARDILPHILALAAASFIYIALADLIPMLHRHQGRQSGFARQFALIALGSAVVPAFGLWAHH